TSSTTRSTGSATTTRTTSRTRWRNCGQRSQPSTPSSTGSSPRAPRLPSGSRRSPPPTLRSNRYEPVGPRGRAGSGARTFLGSAAVLVLLMAGLPPGRALYQPQASVVSANPAAATPNIVDGKVDAVLPMGNRVYVAGSFTGVSNAGESRVIPRHGLFALDPAT